VSAWAIGFCSNIVYIWLRSENVRRSSLSNVPTPPDLRELEKSSALAARTNEVDNNDRALWKIYIFTVNTLKGAHRKIFSLLANFKTFVTHYNGKAAHILTAQSPEFTASFLTHM
jgi:hypothetical protein